MKNRVPNYRIRQMASNILADYAGDYEPAAERLLEFCDGNRGLANAVDREMRFILNPRAVRRQPKQRYRQAA